MTRQQQDRHALACVNLDPVDRHVLHARARIARDDQTRGNVRTVVVFTVRGNGQQRMQVDPVGMYDLLASGLTAGNFAPRQRVVSGIAETFQQVFLGHAHGFRDPCAPGHKAADHRHVVSAGSEEYCRLLAVEPLRHGRELVFQRDRLGDGRHASRSREVGEPATQRQRVEGLAGYGAMLRGRSSRRHVGSSASPSFLK
jgi:hypothetical protein